RPPHDGAVRRQPRRPERRNHFRRRSLHRSPRPPRRAQRQRLPRSAVPHHRAGTLTTTTHSGGPPVQPQNVVVLLTTNQDICTFMSVTAALLLPWPIRSLTIWSFHPCHPR